MTKSNLKILVIRFSSIGDIILTTPVIRALKMQLNAEITFLTKAKFSQVLEQNPNIHKIITLESWDMFDHQYDVIVDLQKNPKSTIISRSLKVKKYSFHKLNLKKWLFTNFKWDLLPEKHLVDRYFEALSPLGITYDKMGLDYYFERQDLRHLNLPNPYIVINCGGTYFTKRIPLNIVNEIIEKAGVNIVLLGGEDVDENVQAIQNSKVVNLIGKVNFETAATIIEGAIKMYTSDSALMHVGAAIDVNMDVIWGNTSPKFGMYPLKDKNSESKTVYKEVELACRPCSKLGSSKCPKGHFKCMLDQEVH